MLDISMIITPDFTEDLIINKDSAWSEHIHSSGVTNSVYSNANSDEV